MKILIVDDDPGIRKVLSMYLERDGYEVVESVDGASALAEAPTCNLVILDLVLPQLSGWDVAKLLLDQYPELPILILSACKTEDERVHGLELGADDYVVKPFSPREVIARVKGLLRRVGLVDELRYGELSIHPGPREVYLGPKAIPLPKLEFDLLLILAQHPGMVWSRERLLERVWGPDFPGITRVVDVRIAALRKKLGDESGGCPYIETVHGVGYKFRDA
jgi:two-component system, OmpR family, alkaline phosphatase synthesis response regulator PhoP